MTNESDLLLEAEVSAASDEPQPSPSIQQRHDKLTAEIGNLHAEHEAAVADEQSSTDTDAMALASSRCVALARRIERLNVERAALEEPLRRAQEREYHERERRNRAEAQEAGAEAIAELDALVCEFARNAAPIMAQISQAEGRGGHLNRQWQRYADRGFNTLQHVTQLALDHLKESERRS